MTIYRPGKDNGCRNKNMCKVVIFGTLTRLCRSCVSICLSMGGFVSRRTLGVVGGCGVGGCSSSVFALGSIMMGRRFSVLCSPLFGARCLTVGSVPVLLAVRNLETLRVGQSGCRCLCSESV